MKVLGIATSPRKGNSQAIVEAVLEGAKKAGADTEMVRLTDREINPCKGCGFCKENPTCVQKDGMVEIYPKITGADAIVIGSPVYFARMNAPAYALIDRMWALINGDFSPKIPQGKKFALALTSNSCGDEVFSPIYEYMKQTMSLFGIKEAGYIWQNHCLKPDDIKNFPEKIEEAKEFGKKLI
ncbi:multimeric flavodoxin WrbA [Methanomicrobium sp. W14]|uniref:flavodoxin family protein n=1 Tax=Methanomicrobium sp. W14 TaxID=2817839 RepID=UPI001AE2BB68|nr:flavodoxin family protein [Methanomicrobium sp. W14]MBP2133803.1 multimeric flavodoxin WrbA [Methanomicrobium sp. W14]